MVVGGNLGLGGSGLVGGRVEVVMMMMRCDGCVFGMQLRKENQD